MEGAAAPMGSWGYGWRTAVLAWVGLSIAAVAVLAVAAFGYEVLTEPSGPRSESTADLSIAEAAPAAMLSSMWLVGIAQVVLLPLAIAAGAVAAGRFSLRRRRRRRAARTVPRPPGGSR